MINRTVAPTFKPVETFNLLSPEERILDNGIRLFSFHAGDQDLVRIEWLFDNLALEKALPLLNVVLSGMLLDGTKQLTGAEIAEKVDFYGAFLQPEYTFDYSSLTLYTLNKHVGKLLPIIKDIFESSIFPEKELNTYCRNNKQTLSVSLKKNDFVARRAFNKAIFSDTRYAYTPELADYDSIIREDLLQLFQQQVQPNNCTIFIAGKVEESILKAVDEFFGRDNWGKEHLQNQRINNAFNFSENPAELIYMEKEDALQSAIRLGSRTINRNHPDFSHFLILNALLGGYFGSRLMSNIREDKGYTYGIGSGIGTLKHSAFLSIATEVGAQVTQATLDEIAKEIHQLRTEKVMAEELELVKNYLCGTFVGSLENVFSHVDKFKRVYLADMDITYYKRHFEIIKQCTADDILAVANKYLHYDNMAKVVVGKL